MANLEILKSVYESGASLALPTSNIQMFSSSSSSCSSSNNNNNNSPSSESVISSESSSSNSGSSNSNSYSSGSIAGGFLDNLASNGFIQTVITANPIPVQGTPNNTITLNYTDGVEIGVDKFPGS